MKLQGMIAFMEKESTGDIGIQICYTKTICVRKGE